jgi:hypothetical protein
MHMPRGYGLNMTEAISKYHLGPRAIAKDYSLVPQIGATYSCIATITPPDL